MNNNPHTTEYEPHKPSITIGLIELFEAMDANDIEKLKEVVKRVEKSSIGAALHLIIDSGNTEVLTVLLGENVNLEIKDKHGYTPLMLACLDGNIEIAKLLVQ